jgi:hypothetical protein
MAGRGYACMERQFEDVLRSVGEMHAEKAEVGTGNDESADYAGSGRGLRA